MTAAGSRPDGAPRVVDAPAGSPETGTLSSAPFLRSRLERLQELDGSALREEWRRLFRSQPPRVSRDLLMRALAYRVQELEFGGLPKWARQSLEGSAVAAGRADPAEAVGAPPPKPALPRPKPGARLVREWHGRIHSVIVLDDAFEFEGRRYRSLTQIAREITGAHWSGPRFFGLVKRSAGPELRRASAHDVDPEETIGLGPPKLGAARIETRRDVVGAVGSNARSFGQPAKESAHG